MIRSSTAYYGRMRMFLYIIYIITGRTHFSRLCIKRGGHKLLVACFCILSLVMPFLKVSYQTNMYTRVLVETYLDEQSLTCRSVR